MHRRAQLVADGGEEFALHAVFRFGAAARLLELFAFAFFTALQHETAQRQRQQQHGGGGQQRQQPGSLRRHAVIVHRIDQVAAIDDPLVAQRLQGVRRDLHQVLIEDCQ